MAALLLGSHPWAELEMAERGTLDDGASKGVLTMVAQIRAEVFDYMLCTPDRDPFDSEGVQLAVETARGLEGEGEFEAAAQWLRRAVREAEKQGNVLRAEDLARAADMLSERAADPYADHSHAASSASMSDAIDDDWLPVVRPEVAVAPFVESPAPRSEHSGAPPAPPAAASIPPLLAALISSMPPFSSRASAEIPPPASAANDDIVATTAVRVTRSMVVTKPVHAVEASVPASRASDTAAERPSRVCAFRAAIPASGRHTNSFFIQRLADGQRAPAGMVEAMIVVTGESDGTIGFEASLDVANSVK